MTEQAEVKQENYVLPEPNLKGGDFARLVHSATVPEGTPFKAVLRPEYWALTSHKVTQFDKIEVVEESGAYYAELLVMARGINRVDVAPLVHIELDKFERPEHSERFEVVWKGPAKKHCILDNKDGKIIQEGITKKSDAYKQLEDHIAVQAR